MSTKDNTKVELLETRSVDFDLESLELRDTDGTMTIQGYAIRFDSLSQDLGGFKEVISKRALDEVDFSDTYLLSQHKTEDVLASSAAGTMGLYTTDQGLYFTAELPDTQLGRDTFTLVKRGDLKSMSFAFSTAKDTWDVTTQPQTRTVQKIKAITELSIVTSPAYKTTSVTKRMLQRCTDMKECTNNTDIINNINKAKELLDSVKQ